ncbi:SDR family NAD(P)-dependent oxidoreductase [Aureimonas flava]|uniref:SDR family NAD(P)-dependent oxidoreductase n=1 Tax=Aureimonas flava TaxID=2320271 RepID=A0A3A1WQ23_9HYPH|nr:SDR family NAD(P)-dependent oxidoreductase [Aureimonas flava]RIY02862.1 SDR family NAD(P)-dependent oxidoreductase [Aureimonas flava]
MKTSGNTILITGGTGGIGRELALRWHAAGNKVVVAGRRRAALDAIATEHPGIEGLVLDVESADGVQAFAREVLARHPEINVLVNNAGIMHFEDAATARDLTDAEATVTTNLLGPIRLTDAFVDHLSSKANAAIVNVTSGLAYVPLVTAPTYNATKAAIHSYTVSLRELLRGKVEVIEIAPPGVQTGLTEGQETRPGYMPLEDFIDEVMALFAAQPTPPEILVERVRPLRFAERDGRFDATLAQLNEMARKAREGQD